MPYLLEFIKKWSLLLILIIIFTGLYRFHVFHYLDFNVLASYEADAQKWTASHYFSAVFAYLLIFTLLVACGIPCATLLTLIGGLLFGKKALFYALFATTLGGTLLFLAVRTAFGARIAARTSGKLKQMERGFQENAFHYLLMLRLVPIFPCWLSNISAGVLNVPLKVFVLATLIGIFPATYIYVLVGTGLDKILMSHPTHITALLLTPSLFFPLMGLAFLSLFPVFYNKIKKRRQH
jgi:uncharacterized membrane protein YdjX (TVP38/TMEM64 family)